MDRTRVVSILLALSTFASAPAAMAAVADHQQCFKIKDDATAIAYSADLVPTDGAFPLAAGCTLKSKASLLCIDVQKTNVSPAPPGADPGLPAQKSLCYKVKCPAPPAPISVTETDQFGSHGLVAKKSSLLCVPIPAPATTTTTLPGSCASAMDCPVVANGTPACMGGTCVIGSCNAGYADCDNTFATGCEVGLNGDTSNCGMCGLVCPVQNDMPICSMGSCGIGACNAGYTDCDMNPMNGCEANTNSDTSNCGTCGLVCNLPNATQACSMGMCGIGSCNPGYLDCDGNPMTGCETNIVADPLNCGGCNIVCPMAFPNCVGSTCVP